MDEFWTLEAVIFGVPWVLLSQLIADSVFVGLVSYEPKSDLTANGSDAPPAGWPLSQSPGR